MPNNKDSMQNVIQTLQALRGQELDPEEQAELDEWNKGRALAQLVCLPGWTVVLEMLASYAANSMQRLVSIDPSKETERNAEHAIAYTASRLYNLFVQDVASAVDKARKTPTTIKNELRKAYPAPPESML